MTKVTSITTRHDVTGFQIFKILLMLLKTTSAIVAQLSSD